MPSSILPVVLTSDSRSSRAADHAVPCDESEPQVSTMRTIAPTRWNGTTGRNLWRLIQIRSPRGGDGVVPETAAGTTPGAGQCVAISRPSIQPAVSAVNPLEKPRIVSIETRRGQSFEITAWAIPIPHAHMYKGEMQFTIVLLYIRDECLFRATVE